MYKGNPGGNRQASCESFVLYTSLLHIPNTAQIALKWAENSVLPLLKLRTFLPYLAQYNLQFMDWCFLF